MIFNAAVQRSYRLNGNAIFRPSILSPSMAYGNSNGGFTPAATSLSLANVPNSCRQCKNPAMALSYLWLDKMFTGPYSSYALPEKNKVRMGKQLENKK